MAAIFTDSNNTNEFCKKKNKNKHADNKQTKVRRKFMMTTTNKKRYIKRETAEKKRSHEKVNPTKYTSNYQKLM